MIRPATLDDAAAIARIQVRTWRAAYADIVPAAYLAAMSVEKRTLSWQQRIADGRSVILVAIEGEEITGWASGGPCRDDDVPGASEVYAIYVSPEYWGRDIGRRLMARMLELLPPGTEVTLWVFRDNHRAIRFYGKSGFRHDGTEKRFELGGAPLSEWRMRRPANPSLSPGF